MPVADKKIILRLALALCLSPALAPCRVFAADSGAAGVPFLSMPVSAAHLGRGVISSPGAMDASDISRFAANSALAGGAQFIYTLSGSLEGRLSHYGAAALPLVYSGALGAFAMSDGADASANSGAFGFSLAKYFPDCRFGSGVNMAFAEREVGGRGEGFAAAGVDFRIDPFDALSGRAYFLNASAGPFRERLANRYGFVVNYHPLPLRGGSNTFGLDIGAGLQRVWREPYTAGVSAEASVRERFFLRAGYENSTKEKLTIDGLSAGLGFMSGYFGMDGAYRFDGKGGGTWAASVKLLIEESKNRTVDENLTIARKYYDKGNFQKSSRYSKNALKRDPGNWNAAAPLTQSETQLRNASGQEFAVIYGGNPKGQAVPYPPSRDAPPFLRAGLLQEAV